MKKIILLALTVSSLLMGKSTVKEETAGWKLIFETDDFNDNVKKCNLHSKNLSKRDTAGLAILNINSKNEKQILSFSGTFLGTDLTYRIDKNNSVTVFAYDMKANMNYNNLIEAFSNGSEVKIKVIPGNQFANQSMDTIPLNDFKRLYKLAETCNYK